MGVIRDGWINAAATDVSRPGECVQAFRLPIPVADRTEAVLPVEFGDERVFLGRNESAAQFDGLLPARMISGSGEYGILDSASEHSAAHQERIDVDVVGFAHQDHDADQAVVAETVRYAPGEYRVALGLDELGNLPKVSTPRGQIELIGLVDELRDSSQVLRLHLEDIDRQLQRFGEFLRTESRAECLSN